MHTLFATHQDIPHPARRYARTVPRPPVRGVGRRMAGAITAELYRRISSRAGRNILHCPAVAIRVVEEDEPAPGEVLYLVDLHAALEQLRACSVDIGNHDLHPLYGAWRCIGE